MKNKLIILALVLCSACFNKRPNYSIALAPVGSESVVNRMMPVKDAYLLQSRSPYIEASAQYWNTSHLSLVSFDHGYPISIQVLPYSESLPINAFTGTQSDAMAYSYDDHCEIKIKQKVLDEENFALLAHEIGHCIGFNHSTNTESLMYPTVSNDQRITSEILSLIQSNRSASSPPLMMRRSINNKREVIIFD